MEEDLNDVLPAAPKGYRWKLVSYTERSMQLRLQRKSWIFWKTISTDLIFLNEWSDGSFRRSLWESAQRCLRWREDHYYKRFVGTYQGGGNVS